MNNALPTDYQSFIHTSRYARWMEDEGRRETWPETVNRFMENVFDPALMRVGDNFTFAADVSTQIENEILSLGTMPSMRAMMTAGAALDRDHTAAYNCYYAPVIDSHVLDEALAILLCGTGVGFSVESRYTSQLPVVPKLLQLSDATIVVGDSKEGWARAYRTLVGSLYEGFIPRWDTSHVRKAGERLKTFGGRASGPEPLEELFRFTIKTFKNARGRRLRPIELHDIMCFIGQIVVVGGVRRSAMISLSDLDDEAMANAKSVYEVLSCKQIFYEEPARFEIRVKNTYGEIEVHRVSFDPDKDQHEIDDLVENDRIGWWRIYPHRALANNSAVYDRKPSATTFAKEWSGLIASGSGERGIFNRQACEAQVVRFGRREAGYEWGTNPCSEIILRPFQFCNLSEVVVRATDTFEDLVRKVTYATILGTVQSTLTNFPYLRAEVKRNTEEERLLGVSLTGIMDSPLLNGRDDGYLEDILETLRKVAQHTNEWWADYLGIPRSAAITCVKPSGTVSQLVDAASGIHARHSPYYIRAVRGDNKDPLTRFMADQGIPNEPDVMKPDDMTVFYFPQRAPEGAVCRDDLSAVEQLKLWLIYHKHWCEHKPSATISVREDEWMEVGAFVYEHFDDIAGVSFLPAFDHSYRQAPYQTVEEVDYWELRNAMPGKIDWTQLAGYEKEDHTKGSQTFACSGESCELVDITA